MLSKKRQFMFEVLGARARAARMPAEQVQLAPPPVAPAPRAARAPKPAPPPKPARVRRPRRRLRTMLPSLPALPSLRGGTWWFTLGGVVLMSVAFVVHRVNRAGGSGGAPVLQINTEQLVPPAEAPRQAGLAHRFAVCAMSQEYRNKSERKIAFDKVQEAVNFCYRAGPDFRDVRGLEQTGKDPNTGTFLVYVGSATTRSELIPLKDKIAALIWNRSRPFQHASVKPVASTGAKEVADER